LNTLNNPAMIDVETGNDALGESHLLGLRQCDCFS
jgi:hypothetical protein